MILPKELEELKSADQWVCYRIEERTDGSGKVGKIPYNPRTGYRAKADSPETWSNYDIAAAAAATGNYDGIGIEFANGIFGIDLDHVRNPETGKLTPQAEDIIKTADTYTEISPSGTGVHMLMKGRKPDGRKRTGEQSPIAVEMYDTGRFFTVTGNVLRHRPVADRTDAAAQIHKKYFPQTETQPQSVVPVGAISNSSDADLLSMARNSSTGKRFTDLWNGDCSAYGNDHSKADQALVNDLCYWCNGDYYRIDKLFRQSGLMRPKWDEKHGSSTYGEITVNTALKGFKPYIAPAKPIPQVQNTSARPDNVVDYFRSGGFDADKEKFKRFKDRKTGFPNMDAIQSLYPGLYVLGAISSLGKTTFALQIADSLACAGDEVIYYSFEQNKLEMISKCLSRRMFNAYYAIDGRKCYSAINIRRGIADKTPELDNQIENYKKQVGERLSIVFGNFNYTIEQIEESALAYMKANKVRPVIFIDYLQIVTPSTVNGRPLDSKLSIDHIVHELKTFQSKYDLVIIVLSSLNRQNYLTPIDYESFKESGGIEYTADVVWGLQLEVMNDDIFSKEAHIKEKREKVKISKSEIPRRLELCCLKNRYGIANYTCSFNYYSEFDNFIDGNEFTPADRPTPFDK